ncbi:hypothetical protein D9M71_467660 [compost metagenome]
MHLSERIAAQQHAGDHRFPELDSAHVLVGGKGEHAVQRMAGIDLPAPIRQPTVDAQGQRGDGLGDQPNTGPHRRDAHRRVNGDRLARTGLSPQELAPETAIG